MLFKTSQEFLLDLLITLSISQFHSFFQTFFVLCSPTHSLISNSFIDTGNAFLLTHIILDIT